MISRQPCGTKSIPHVPLRIVSDDDKAWFEKGERERVFKKYLASYILCNFRWKNIRREREEQSLFKTPPTAITESARFFWWEGGLRRKLLTFNSLIVFGCVIQS